MHRDRKSEENMFKDKSKRDRIPPVFVVLYVLDLKT